MAHSWTSPIAARQIDRRRGSVRLDAATCPGHPPRRLLSFIICGARVSSEKHAERCVVRTRDGSQQGAVHDATHQEHRHSGDTRTLLHFAAPRNITPACAPAPSAGRSRPSLGSCPLCFRLFPGLSGSVHSTEFSWKLRRIVRRTWLELPAFAP